MNLLVFINEATFRKSPRFLFRSISFLSQSLSLSLSLNLLFFYSFSVPQVMIFIAYMRHSDSVAKVCGPWICGFCNSAYAKGSHNLLPFQKVILHIAKCACVFRFGVFHTRSWFEQVLS